MSTADLVLTPRGLRFAGRYWPATHGRGGIARNKREGDGATPTGVHRIVAVLYRPDRVPPPSKWALAIDRNDLWSDASGQPDYNLMVRAPYPHSHERLFRADPLYDIVLVTNWNWPQAKAGQGSAIFLHQWRGPGRPTEGCIAFSRTDMRKIAQRVRPGMRVIVR